MKKAIAIILAVLTIFALIALLLCGCGRAGNQKDWDRLIKIEDHKNFDVYADVQTGVEYFVWLDGYRCGISAIFDADGKPVLAPNFDAREDAQ